MENSVNLKEQSVASDCVSQFAHCWKITLVSGIVKCFTDCDRDLILDGLLYRASSGVSSSVIESHASLGVANLQVEGIISSDQIDESDLLCGLYDSASVTMFVVDYTAPERNKLFLRRGILGNITVKDKRFFAEILGISVRMQSQVGENFSQFCRANFCDQKCGLDPQNYTYIGKVTKQTGSIAFYDDTVTMPLGYYDGGTVKFLDGINQGGRFIISKYKEGEFSLSSALEHPLKQGDSYEVVAGCDKSFATCIAKFGNYKRFRGDPFLI